MRAPLAGFSIVNLAVNLPGPLAAYQLTNLGATVIKVEPLQGDPLKLASPEFYKLLSRQQKIVSLDLKNQRDRQILAGYLEKSDLLITASRPQALEKLSLGWNSLHAQHPKLCLLRIVGFAPPNQNKVGHDLTYQAFAGLLDPPKMPIMCVADFSGAQEASLQTISLLLERERTGAANFAEVSLFESAQYYGWARKFGLTARPGLLSGTHPEYQIYRAKTGWVAVATLEEHFKTRLQNLLQLEEMNEGELERVFRKRTAKEWQVWADENDLPIAEIDC